MKHFNQFDQNDLAYKQALNNALTLFPYIDGDLEDDINSAKRLIYINGFMDGVPYKEIRNHSNTEEYHIPTVYKIFNTTTNLYSSGGMYPEWTRVGKTWSNITNLRSHLKQFSRYNKRIPDDWIVIELNGSDKISTLNILDILNIN